jgi:excisionase family DNA binding protein
MTAQGETYQRLTVSDAAAALGVSRMTVRRMIQRGQLEAERVHRPQGTAYLVTLPADGTGQGTPTARPARHTGRPNGTEQPAPGEAIAAMLQATLTPIVAPLVAELAASRQANERLADQLMGQADRIAELERENGLLTAENHALEARTAVQSVEPIMEAPMSRWRRHLPWLIAAAVLTVMVVLFVFAPGVR